MSVRKICLGAAIACLCSGATLCRALDQDRLWVPKTYQSAMPALVAAARAAENTQRCQEVVTGKIVESKSSAETWHFVVTCRDKGGRTYSLSYRSPVAGSVPELVAEQRSGVAVGAVPVDLAERGITEEQATTLCLKEFAPAVDVLDDVQPLDESQSAAVQRKGRYYLTLPFTARSDLGNRVLYEARCEVSRIGETRYTVELQREGALAICQDHLRSEAALLGRVTPFPNLVVDVEAERGFRFHIPFDAKTLAVDAVRYLADCQVDSEGESSLTIALQTSGAFTLCAEALRKETLLLRRVAMESSPIAENHTEQTFSFEMAFQADDPDGNSRRFVARCRVDGDGETSLETALDRRAIAAVCVGGVRSSARNMIDVQILEDKIPPLVEDEHGLMAVIPFNAKDPSGRLLQFDGECRVDENGRTRVKLKPRNL